MDSLSTGAAWRPYVRVVVDTALDAATAGGWIAAGGLSPGRRRLARVGVTAFAAATAIPGLTAAKSAAKSAARSAAESAPEPAPEAAAGRASEPASEPAAVPADKPADEPTDKPADEPAQQGSVELDPARRARPPLVILRDTPVTVTGARRTTAQVAAAVAVLGGVTAASVGVAMAGRRLERRWLARLIRQGHPHPHRALGLRMAAVWAAATLPARLLTARKAPGHAR